MGAIGNTGAHLDYPGGVAVLHGLHSLGLCHKHATVAEHDACLACQVVDHQSSVRLMRPPGPPFYLLTLLLLALLWHPGVVRGFQFFSRPSHGHPLSLSSPKRQKRGVVRRLSGRCSSLSDSPSAGTPSGSAFLRFGSDSSAVLGTSGGKDSERDHG